MGEYVLASLKTGITRLRPKGGASPQSLYDCVNGYVDASGAPTGRPGTKRYHVIPTTGTKGCATFNNKIVVFANTVTDPDDDRFICIVLRHATDPASLIRKIHFAKPIAGALYVIAEFSDGAVFHYWIEEPDVWEADTVYMEGQLVSPTTPNGFTYMATRNGPPNPLWAAGVVREIGDRVEPTTANGYYYEVIDVVEGDTGGSGEPPTNQPLTNAGFETGTTAGWSSSGPHTFGVNNSVAYEGTYSAFVTIDMTNSAAETITGGTVPIELDAMLRISCRIQWPALSGADQLSFKLGVEWLDSMGASLGFSTQTSGRIYPSSPGAGTWVELERTMSLESGLVSDGRVPVGTVSYRPVVLVGPYIQVSVGTKTVRLDDFILLVTPN